MPSSRPASAVCCRKIGSRNSATEKGDVEGQRKRGRIASLLVGQLDEESRLVYVGSVSASVRVARGLETVLPSLLQDKSGLVRRRSHKIDRTARWVAPLLVATVRPTACCGSRCSAAFGLLIELVGLRFQPPSH